MQERARHYHDPAEVSVSDAEMKTLLLTTDPFHGEWNYALAPRIRLPERRVTS